MKTHHSLTVFVLVWLSSVLVVQAAQAASENAATVTSPPFGQASITLMESEQLNELIKSLADNYRNAKSDQQFIAGVKEFIAQIPEGRTDYAVFFAYELSKSMDPTSRYHLLVTLGKNLKPPHDSNLRHLIYYDLYRLALRERRQHGMDNNYIPDKAKNAQARAIGQHIKLIKKESLPSDQMTIHHFRSLALGALDGCRATTLNKNPSDNVRYHCYEKLKEIGPLAPLHGEIEHIFMNRKTGIFALVSAPPRNFFNVTPARFSQGNPVKEITAVNVANDRKDFEHDIQLNDHEDRLRKIEDSIVRLDSIVAQHQAMLEQHEQRITANEHAIQQIRVDMQKLRAELYEAIRKAIEKYARTGDFDHPKNDYDLDNIPDTFERALLQRFSPAIRIARKAPRYSESHGPPVTVQWLLNNASLHKPGGFVDENPQQFLANSTGLAVSSDWSLHLKSHWGEEGKMDWGTIDEVPIYGHVWQPWPKKEPNHYSVQYYMYCTYSDTAYSGGQGNHEGDWMCVDFGVKVANTQSSAHVDKQSRANQAKLVHAIYHNHGRQLFVKRKALKIHPDDGGEHPEVWLETQVNEAWPNPGFRGTNGWPRKSGFATNLVREYEKVTGNVDLKIIKVPRAALNQANEMLNNVIGRRFTDDKQNTEYKVVREHGRLAPNGPVRLTDQGDGKRYWTRWNPSRIIKLGEHFEVSSGTRQGEAIPTTKDPAARFIHSFQGRWGGSSNSPKGPPYQIKMWNRIWDPQGLRGPWGHQAGSSTDPQATSVGQSETYKGIDVETYKVKINNAGDYYLLFGPAGHQF